MNIDDFLSQFNVATYEVIELGYKGKKGTLSENEMRLVGKMHRKGGKLKDEKTFKEFLSLLEEGNEQAIREVNPFG